MVGTTPKALSFGPNMQIYANGLSFEVTVNGDAHAPAVLLTMGLGMQLVAWPMALVEALVDAGYRVIRYDNRDIGLSSHMDAAGVPNMTLQILKHKLGFALHPAYRLQDMALDALGILDAFNIESAHIVGVSMGGMISQRIAIAAPARVRSLTSVMSSSSAPKLPGAKPHIASAMLARPKSTQLHDVVEHSLRLFQMIGSPGYPQDPVEMRERLTASAKRSYHPAGVSRQLLAIVADTQRYKELATITAPTLVIHGTDDPLVPIACGKDTASRIPNAAFVAIEGMGHDWPAGVTVQLCEHIIPLLKRADATGTRMS
jgi:pimeloyl-ACP methyl ester carboxylesterase